jgi:hypothetical protein
MKNRTLNIAILTISLLALLLAAGLWIRSDAYIPQDADRAQWIAFWTLDLRHPNCCHDAIWDKY